MAQTDLTWKAEWACDWVSVTPSEGTGYTPDVDIRIIKEADYGETNLKCDVIFKAFKDNNPVSETVVCVYRCEKKCKCDSLIIKGNGSNLSQTGGTSIQIGTYSGEDSFMQKCFSPTAISGYSDEEWVISGSIEFKDGKILADISENESTSPREATISVNYNITGEDNSCSKEFVIKQSGSDCDCNDFSISGVEDPLMANVNLQKIGEYYISKDDTSCFSIISVTTSKDWLSVSIENFEHDTDNKLINNGSISGIVTERSFDDESACIVTVEFSDGTTNCQETFNVYQTLCGCESISGESVHLSNLNFDKSQLECEGEEIEFEITSDNVFNENDTHFIGTFKIADCIDETEIKKSENFKAYTSNQNIEVKNISIIFDDETRSGKIYANIKGTINSNDEVVIRFKYKDRPICDLFSLDAQKTE